MAKKYPRGLAEGQLREGCSRCIENVNGLLNSASILLEYEYCRQYALGLYMYAVEEFGKAILLKKVIRGNQTEYEIPKWIFESHDNKLIEGFSNLPNECSNISRGIKVTIDNLSSKTRRIRIDSAREILIPASLTGEFYDMTTDTGFKQNIVLKTACFYMGWDNKNDTWRYDILTDAGLLKKNIHYFRKTLDQFKCM